MVLPVMVALKLPLCAVAPPPVRSSMPWLLYWRMALPVMSVVTVPPPALWILSAEPSSEPEFATPATPMVLLAMVPASVAVPVDFTINTAVPTESRKSLPVRFKVRLPVPLVKSVTPPPPVPIRG